MTKGMIRMKKDVLYVAIGDSLTVGYGAPSNSGFVDRYSLLAQRKLKRQVQLVNTGVNGAASGEILSKINKNKEIQNTLKEAQIITITAGGNDLLDAAKPFFYQGETLYLYRAVKSFHENIQKIIQVIKSTKKGSKEKFMVKLIGLYNPFPMVPEAAFWVKAFNKQMEKVAKPPIEIVPTYQLFAGKEEEYLYEDHIHPNQKGYEAIAKKVHQSGYTIL